MVSKRRWRKTMASTIALGEKTSKKKTEWPGTSSSFSWKTNTQTPKMSWDKVLSKLPGPGSSSPPDGNIRPTTQRINLKRVKIHLREGQKSIRLSNRSSCPPFQRTACLNSKLRWYLLHLASQALWASTSRIIFWGGTILWKTGTTNAKLHPSYCNGWWWWFPSWSSNSRSNTLANRTSMFLFLEASSFPAFTYYSRSWTITKDSITTESPTTPRSVFSSSSNSTRTCSKLLLDNTSNPNTSREKRLTRPFSMWFICRLFARLEELICFY